LKTRDEHNFFAEKRVPCAAHLSLSPHLFMHRALGIQDVVTWIVKEVEAAGLRDVVALARVSRVFSEPALDVLWAEPPIWDLAMLMDDDVMAVLNETRTMYNNPDYRHTWVEHTVVSFHA
jgi:hypothetical protein